MTSHEARSSGCAPFEEELVNAMNRYANSADAPDFDAPGIVRRTRRRRAVGIAAVATALIVAGGGTALAAMSDGTGHRARPAASRTAASTKHDAATVLYGFHGDDKNPLPIDFYGWDLQGFKSYMEKTQMKLGTVSKRPVTGCKPGSVIVVSPHTPKIVKAGDTINVVLCSG
ncbi:hypothetical protein [Streptomyces griseorubiginosus]|uniref:hypothetical protein n=1 Tax=Streptomyces griseorubiginosus TaxID=67304 RepID=UPI001AD6FABF|nr:hypothetical protein [Streptomyces griseorubiginosus]MBO4259885.1 hypothetical protein [Streptomyces griseorubiginosus]